MQNTFDSGSGSLRQAIIDSNGVPGRNSISFNITPSAASYVIDVQNALPAITNPVLIDGTSQPGYSGIPIITLNDVGTGAGPVGDGLLLAPGSDGSTIEGLDIANFQDPNTGAGVHIQSSGNLVAANSLGTNLAGTLDGPGNQIGVFIDGGSQNTIGGTGSLGNLISGNISVGVLIQDGTQLATGNLVIGNKVGTDASGTVAVPNQGDGIDLYASGNTIGGTITAAANLVSANLGYGINISNIINPADDNTVEGNLVGTDISGMIALGNGSDGITDNSDAGNTIGGTASGAGNLCSANQGQGISLFSVSNDLLAGNILGTTPGSITDNPSRFHRLGNAGNGILVTAQSTNNVIGLPARGT